VSEPNPLFDSDGSECPSMAHHAGAHQSCRGLRRPKRANATPSLERVIAACHTPWRGSDTRETRVFASFVSALDYTMLSLHSSPQGLASTRYLSVILTPPVEYAFEYCDGFRDRFLTASHSLFQLTRCRNNTAEESQNVTGLSMKPCCHSFPLCLVNPAFML
jgi:hypothetical protein